MNHAFLNPVLLQTALTHTSHAHEHGGDHNERMEFLGDAVLQIFATELLYQRFPEEREGVLHSYRSTLVSTTHLAGLARAWKLDEQVRLGKGEESSGGRDKERLLAGLFEAVLGAVYLDGGYDIARGLVYEVLSPDLDSLPQHQDLRKVLHEWAQQQTGAPPEYTVVHESGPAHALEFTVEVRVDGQARGEGVGPSKRAATIAAAHAAVDALEIQK